MFHILGKFQFPNYKVKKFIQSVLSDISILYIVRLSEVLNKKVRNSLDTYLPCSISAFLEEIARKLKIPAQKLLQGPVPPQMNLHTKISKFYNIYNLFSSCFLFPFHTMMSGLILFQESCPTPLGEKHRYLTAGFIESSELPNEA